MVWFILKFTSIQLNNGPFWKVYFILSQVYSWCILSPVDRAVKMLVSKSVNFFCCITSVNHQNTNGLEIKLIIYKKKYQKQVPKVSEWLVNYIPFFFFFFHNGIQICFVVIHFLHRFVLVIKLFIILLLNTITHPCGV